MPLIKGFKSTSIWKAFILNSLASSLIILLAISIKDHLDSFTDDKGRLIHRKTTPRNLLLTFIVTFIATLGAYILLYFLFGYGGGFLVNS